MFSNNLCERDLPLKEGQPTQVAPVVHEAIEDVIDRFASATQKVVETRPALRIENNDFAV